MFVRIVVQRAIALNNNKIDNGIAAQPVDPGTPIVQTMGMLAVAF